MVLSEASRPITRSAYSGSMEAFVGRLHTSKLFVRASQRAFEESDIDHDQKLDVKEVYAALLRLYDKLNAKSPARLDPPGFLEVQRLFQKFDTDHSGSLEYSEFQELAKTLFVDVKDWRSSIALKVILAVTIKLIIVPLASKGLKAGLVKAGTPYAERIPAGVLSAGLDMVGKFALH